MGTRLPAPTMAPSQHPPQLLWARESGPPVVAKPLNWTSPLCACFVRLIHAALDPPTITVSDEALGSSY